VEQTVEQVAEQTALTPLASGTAVAEPVDAGEVNTVVAEVAATNSPGVRAADPVAPVPEGDAVSQPVVPVVPVVPATPVSPASPASPVPPAIATAVVPVIDSAAASVAVASNGGTEASAVVVATPPAPEPEPPTPETPVIVLQSVDAPVPVASGEDVRVAVLAPQDRPTGLAVATDSALDGQDAATVVSPTSGITLPGTEVIAATQSVDPITPAVRRAPTILLAGKNGVQVLQGQGPDAMENVVIDSITYDAGGEVVLAGRGQDRGFVRVYLNNAPIQTTRIAADGAWRTPLPDVDTGIYTLRVDQIDAQGAVISRTETPFLRESAEVLANTRAATTPAPVTAAVAEPAGDTGTGTGTASAAPAPARVQAVAITVQPGSTLWAIARESYGDGMQYMRVFEANRDNIRNPDLIYPGQVFAVPD
jgi:nucleoid-associated protein YgaU